MIAYNPAFRRPGVLGQTATPAPAPVVVQTPAPTSPLVNMIGWTVVGFGAGAAAGYVMGKGLGRKTDIMDALIGGAGGAVASFLAKVI